MSEWSDRLKASLVWRALEELGPALDSAEKREDLDASSLEALVRIRTALSFIGRRLATADAALVQIGPIDAAGNHLQNTAAEVQQFTANGSYGHLANANSNIDSALGYLAQVNIPLVPVDLQALREAADRYRDSLESYAKRSGVTVAQLGAHSDALAARLSELANEMAAERQRLSSLTSDYQSQFSSAQDARSTEYNAAQALRQDKFADWSASATEALSKQEAASTRDRERLAAEQATALQQLRTDYENQARQVLAEIRKQQSDVEKLVGVIGNLGVTSGYLNAAKEARITVRVWQGIAVAAMAGLIAVAYFTFLPVMQGTFTWESFAGRVFFTLTVGVLAAYAASQADKYHSIERRSRAAALELEAIGPFLAPLPLEKQQEFRLTIGDRTFGHAEIPALSTKSPATTIDLLMKSKEFRSFIADLVKAARSG
ncbi:MAG: hypothetical protein IPJ56_16230 [Gemmatimonadetes bacterium]|nr:hypothetical protein [Gemmatimonadota bacterium]